MLNRSLLLIIFYLFCATNICGQKKQNLAASRQSAVWSKVVDTIGSYKCNTIAARLPEITGLQKQLQADGQVFLLSRYHQILGDYYWGCTANTDEAFGQYRLALSYGTAISDTGRIFASATCLFRIFKQTGRSDSAFRYLRLLLALKSRTENFESALGEAGLFYHDLGDYKTSLQYYDSLLQILNSRASVATLKQTDSINYITTLLNISDIYLSIKEYEKALVNYNLCIALGVKMNNVLARFYGLYGLGKTLSGMRKYDDAIATLKKALEYGRQNSQTSASSEVANLLAECYLKTGAIEQAVACNAESRKLAEGRQYRKQLAICDITYGRIALYRKEFGAAVTSFSKGMEGAIAVRDLELQKTAWEALSEGYTGQDKPALALVAYRNYIDLKDSLYSIEKASELAHMDMEATFSRRQLVDSMAHEHRAAAITLKLQRQTLIAYTSLAGIALFCILAFLMYRNYSTQKKYNELLNKEKVNHLAHIEEQSNVLSDIAFTQAHDIRGPLTTLLGLTQILNTEDPADPENKEILEGIVSVTERLDKAVKGVISKENNVNEKERRLTGK